MIYVFFKTLALPPANLVFVILVGLAIRIWRKRLGTAIAVSGALLLYALSTAFVSSFLMASLADGVQPPDLSIDPSKRPGAIVVLSAGFSRLTPERYPLTVDEVTLERLRAGVRLHKETGLPILVTGGRGRGEPTKLADLMQRTLRRDFGVEAKWVEDRSRTTYENALYSAELLKPLGIRSVYIVTQDWHIPRAVAAFAAAGLEGIAAPSRFGRPSRLNIFAFLPSAGALGSSYYALHEMLGLVWYRWALFDR